VADTHTMESDIAQMRILLADDLRFRSRIGKALGTGSSIFSNTPGNYVDSSLSRMVSDKQYCSMTLVLSGGSTTPTNIRIEIATEQGAMPLTLNMTAAQNYVEIHNVRINKIWGDATSLGSGILYINWVTYDQPTGNPDIKTGASSAAVSNSTSNITEIGGTAISLGAASTSLSLPVVTSLYATPVSSQTTITTAATRFPSQPCAVAIIKNDDASANPIYVGNASVTATSGLQLKAGEGIVVECANSNIFYAITATSTATLDLLTLS
jgi:hypothetical protein